LPDNTINMTCKCTLFELSKTLGHSTIATTSKYYGHLLTSTSKKIAALLDSDMSK